MVIEQRNLNGINILRLDGVLGVGSEADLHEVVQQHVRNGATAFVFDMTHVPHMDSTGISALVGAYCSITRGGGRLVLAHLHPHVAKVLQVTRLLSVFEHVGQVDEAVTRLAVEAQSVA